MRKTVAVLAAALLGVAFPAVARAQDPTPTPTPIPVPDTTALRNAVTRAEILRYEQRLNAIALSNENTRGTATTGNWESLDFVINELRKMGYNPSFVPYANGNPPNTWSERTPMVLEQISPTPKAYKTGLTCNTATPQVCDDVAAMTWSTNADVTGRVIPVGRIVIPPVGQLNGNSSGCSMTDYPPEVKDNIALIQRGNCTFVEKVNNARAAGARAIMIFNEGNEGQVGRQGPGTSNTARFASLTYPAMPAVGLSFAAGKELYDAAQAGPVTVHLKTDVNLNQRIDYDIIAETPGGDPNRVLQVGAHIDSVGSTTNPNGNHGPGINDDGTGTAMNLAIAHQILKLGIPLKYKIRFGWFSGEEQGLFGSQFYVNQLHSVQTAQTLAMLDYDMIASTNWIPFMYIPPTAANDPTTPAQKADEATLSKVHIDYLQQRLNIERRDYPIDNRSDYAGWRARAVPATGLFTGAETVKTADEVAKWGGQAGIQADPCYHEWCDTVFNLSQFGLDEFSDVLAHAVVSFAGVVGDRTVELPIRDEQWGH